MGKYGKAKESAKNAKPLATRSSKRILANNQETNLIPTNKTPVKQDQKITPNKMSTRKSGNVSKSVTPTKAIKKTRKISKPNKMADRTHYTVREDAIILITIKQSPGESFNMICQKLAEILNHTSESIRDRIKRYLSKLTKRDEKVIIEANQRIPGHYIYFMNDKSHGKKNISHISLEPPLIGGKSLTLRDRKNVAKLHRFKIMQERQRKRIMMDVMQLKKSEIMNQDENITALDMEDNDHNSFLSKSPFKTAPTQEDLRKLTPTRSANVKEDAERQRLVEEALDKVNDYKSKLRKRNPEELKNMFKTQTYDFEEENDYYGYNKPWINFHIKDHPHVTTQLEDNIEMFLHQLSSEAPNDVNANAEILSEIVDNLALTFNLSTDNIVEIIKDCEGKVNVENVRSEI